MPLLLLLLPWLNMNPSNSSSYPPRGRNFTPFCRLIAFLGNLWLAAIHVPSLEQPPCAKTAIESFIGLIPITRTHFVPRGILDLSTRSSSEIPTELPLQP